MRPIGEEKMLEYLNQVPYTRDKNEIHDLVKRTFQNINKKGKVVRSKTAKPYLDRLKKEGKWAYIGNDDWLYIPSYVIYYKEGKRMMNLYLQRILKIDRQNERDESS